MAEEIKKTILIAEDEEDLLEMYSMALSSKGFEVLKAINGIQALEWLEKKYDQIDLILLDIVMPGMDGFETLEKIKKDDRFKKIPVVVSTNLDNSEDKAQAMDLGARDYFVKSQHTPSELVAEAETIISYNDNLASKKIV
ncbi:MAG: Response regulator receiver modulated metal dependent phosphohydrolase [uncultured bacterium]|nr:MAG: Response regulator receiver modulated metal dependent phosphohydrolase [uncultured bacterium]